MSAGNAVVLARLLAGPDDRVETWPTVLFGAGLLTSIGLVVLSLIRATGVLVTPRASRETFTDARDLPPGLVFNDSDTVRELRTFDDFKAVVRAQDYPAMLEAAQVELWIGIRQHRHRYQRLRAAAQVLRWAAVVFLVSLAGYVVTVLVETA
ncbi:hypothetical protein [Streptomyces sp. NPDC050982]|uniref:hypothetical protein n=1 Tax=Streptomyces sp. NPDC050982 TaxID=3154746 RepID=UPI0033C230D7